LKTHRVATTSMPRATRPLLRRATGVAVAPTLLAVVPTLLTALDVDSRGPGFD